MVRPVRVRTLAPAFLIALLVLSIAAPVVQAADTLQDRAVTSYEIVPSKHVIHVTQVYTFTNRKASTSSSRTCYGVGIDYFGYTYTYSYECGYKTTYYYNGWKEYFQNDATHFKVKGNSGSASIKLGKKGKDGWRLARIKYSPLYYGKSRTLTVQYDLPAGGARSTAKRLAGYTQAKFCAFGPGTDKGRVRIVAPKGYQLSGAVGMTHVTKNGKEVWATEEITKKPWLFSACVQGTNPTAITTTTAQAGDTDVTVTAWKGDSTWSDAVNPVVTDELPAVSALLGAPAGGSQLTIKEGEGGSAYDPSSGELTLSQYVVDRDVARDAIVAAWFDRNTFLSDWVKVGYIRWAQDAAGVGNAACDEPGTPPAGSASLSSWQLTDPVTGTALDAKETDAWKAQAACYVIKTVNDAIGPERTAAVLAALRSGADPWVDGEQRTSRIANWQDWLDAVTELGIIPAGADATLVPTLATTYGIAEDEAALTSREEARVAYHALEAKTGGPVPSPITEAMRSWDAEAALAMVKAANTAWDTAATVPAIVDGVTVDGGTVQQAVLAATSQADLDAAVTMAEQQVAAAKIAAEALAAKAKPLDTMQQVGLDGDALPADEEIIAAVNEADPGAAQQAATEVDAALAGASEAGTQRIGLGIGAIVVVIGGIIAAVVLGKRRSKGPALATASAAGPVAPVAPAPVSVPQAWGQASAQAETVIMDTSPTTVMQVPATPAPAAEPSLPPPAPGASAPQAPQPPGPPPPPSA